jgi:hypothetical protein
MAQDKIVADIARTVLEGKVPPRGLWNRMDTLIERTKVKSTVAPGPGHYHSTASASMGRQVLAGRRSMPAAFMPPRGDAKALYRLPKSLDGTQRVRVLPADVDVALPPPLGAFCALGVGVGPWAVWDLCRGFGARSHACVSMGPVCVCVSMGPVCVHGPVCEAVNLTQPLLPLLACARARSLLPVEGLPLGVCDASSKHVTAPKYSLGSRLYLKPVEDPPSTSNPPVPSSIGTQVCAARVCVGPCVWVRVSVGPCVCLWARVCVCGPVCVHVGAPVCRGVRRSPSACS